MATGTRSKSTRMTARAAAAPRSGFAWPGGQTGVLAAAAMAGAAVGIAANYGRKMVVQHGGGAGDWADALAAEHQGGARPVRQARGDRRRARAGSAPIS